MNKDKINEILDMHEQWLNGEDDGKCAELSDADLQSANLRGADLRDADLQSADLRDADLQSADLRDADLRRADLRGADLQSADLRDADLQSADLRDADLSGAKGLLSAIDFMARNFEQTDAGYFAYKVFGVDFKIPKEWEIKENSVITETVNPNRQNNCGCGINIAPLEWVKRHYPNEDVYKLLIKWEWLPGVIVPYNTDGKIRCEKAMIIEKVNL